MTIDTDSDENGTPGDREAATARQSRALDRNVAAIKEWEQRLLGGRSPTERVSDWITTVAAGGFVLAAHALWFTGWIVVNLGVVDGVAPFDPFPFPSLAMAVSLEAIFLSLFVLASQNRLSRQADKRAHLNLQIDLLAEREMTTVLRLLQDIALHLEVQETVTPEEIGDLVIETDLPDLARRMDEFEENGKGEV